MATPITFSTLLKRSDFLRLNRGQKFVAPCFILRALPQLHPSEACRVGYTVTTKCGNAVIRNRTKRRLRALMRELLPIHGRSGTDYVIIARADVAPSAAEVPISELRAQLEKGLLYMQARLAK
jgi:ribonuclease P protein component